MANFLDSGSALFAQICLYQYMYLEFLRQIMMCISGSVEDLVPTEAEQFDAVVSSEVIEHVADLKQFIDSCCKLVKVCQV